MGKVLSDDAINFLNQVGPAAIAGQIGQKIDQLYNGGQLEPGIRFIRTGQITSAAAATPVSLIADSEVPAGKKVYLTGWRAKVNGATLWATTANVKIQDTNSSPVDFVTMLVAALTANARVQEGVANTTTEDAISLATGGTAGKGVQLLGNANGTGSTLVVTIEGYIR